MGTSELFKPLTPLVTGFLVAGFVRTEFSFTTSVVVGLVVALVGCIAMLYTAESRAARLERRTKRLNAEDIAAATAGARETQQTLSRVARAMSRDERRRFGLDDLIDDTKMGP